LSWVGPSYADQGWVELTDEEQAAARKAEVMARVNIEKNIAAKEINNPEITVGEKSVWVNYLLALDEVCLCPDFDCDPKFPQRP